jgi:DNA modification methylase
MGEIKEYNNDGIELYLADCFDVMPNIPDESVDAIICDPPFGSTSCSWDVILPFDKLWEQYERIIKPNGIIILNATQPFASHLIMSNLKLFRYELIWDKVFGVSSNISKFRPMISHENILIFYKHKPTFNPIFLERPESSRRKQRKKTQTSEISKDAYVTKNVEFTESDKKNPVSIITVNRFSKECNPKNRIHPTQKPEELISYLVSTYTNEGDLVLDNTFGSGTCPVVCKKLKRRFIGMEKEEKYFDMTLKRLSEVLPLENKEQNIATNTEENTL